MFNLSFAVLKIGVTGNVVVHVKKKKKKKKRVSLWMWSRNDVKTSASEMVCNPDFLPRSVLTAQTCKTFNLVKIKLLHC